jgi:hypothetical protein
MIHCDRHNPKTDIVVAVGGIVVVAVGSTTIRGIVVTRSAAFTEASPKEHCKSNTNLM